MAYDYTHLMDTHSLFITFPKLMPHANAMPATYEFCLPVSADPLCEYTSDMTIWIAPIGSDPTAIDMRWVHLR